MKKIRKFISLMLAVCAITSAMTIGVSATNAKDDNIICEMITEQTPQVYSVRSISTGSAYLPKANSSGTNGNPCAPFVAEDTDVAFTIISAPGATTYNVQLYAGTPGRGYKVAEYDGKLPIQNGAYFRNLIVGQSYYFMISSYDISSNGCTATYELNV